MTLKPAAWISVIVLAVAVLGGSAALLRYQAGPNTQEPAGNPPDNQPEPANPLPFVRAFTVVQGSAAYVEPDKTAPKLYDVPAGSPLCSVDITQDGRWVAAMTADGQAAWVATADLGPFDKTAIPHGNLPDQISGTPEVVNSGVLKVGDREITLAGLSGLSGEYARQMTSTIAQNGNRVECVRFGTGYTCKLPIGSDVGSLALYDGIAVDSGCATADYLSQEEAARKAPRGIWK
jgi:hypothetical protein